MNIPTQFSDEELERLVQTKSQTVTQDMCIKLAKELREYRTQNENNPGVWDGAPENAASATIIYRTEKSIPCSYGKEFYRDLPKTRAREIAEKAREKIRDYLFAKDGQESSVVDDIIESAINEALKDN